MQHQDHRPLDRTANGHPTAGLLRAEALGLVLAAAACFGAGAIVAAALTLVLAAVAAGLATSLAEGFPGCAPAILGFEGVTLAVLIAPVTLAGAVALLAATGAGWGWAHHRSRAQIRRPVSCQ
jgi:hypothetical protein